MKKRVLWVFVGLAIIALMQSAFASDVYVSSVYSVPSVATPGSVVYVLATVSNADSGTVDNIQAQLTGPAELNITPINSEITHLPPYGSATVSFAVKMPNNPKPLYILNLQLTSGPYSYAEKTVPIFVAAPRALAVETENTDVRAGSCKDVQITLKNSSNTPITNITITAAAMPPIYTTGDTSIDYIAPNSEKSVEIQVCSDADAISGVYPVTLTISYNSGSGKGVATRQIPVIVENEPHVIVAGVRTTPTEIKELRDANISIILQNTSAEPAYDVQVFVGGNICSPKYSVPPTAETPIYRGMGTTVTIQCSGGVPAGKHNIPIRVSFMDRYGKRFNAEYNVPVTVERFPKLEIVHIWTENIYTAETGRLIVELKNVGSASAEYVSVYSDPEWPFYTDQKRDFIQEIQPGKEANTILYLSVYPNAKTQHYGLKIRIEYQKKGSDDTVTDSHTVSVPVTRTGTLAYIGSWIIQNPLFSAFAIALIVGLIYIARRAEKNR